MIEKHCDLLCIGGGGAGVAASVAASRKGADVLLCSKEPIGYGNTRIIGGVMAYGDLGAEKTGEDFFRDMIVGGDYLNNQEICSLLASNAHQATYLVESFGGVLGRDKEGRITEEALIQLGGHTSPRTLFIPSTGPGIGQALRYAVAREEIEILENTLIVDLIQQRNQTFGAIGYELVRGDVVVIKAKKTLLATGGGGWLYYPNTDVSRVITGDGYALGLNAGAELIDMEQVQYIPFSITHPPGLAGIVVGEPFTAGPAGVLRNVHGKDILPGVYQKTRAQVANAIILEVEKGNGTKHGGCLLDLKGNKDHPGGRMLFEQYSKGIFKNITDIIRLAYGPEAASWEEPWDVYPSAHYFMGGIVIDIWGRVKGVDNLFACGEVSGGIHGGNRLGSVSLMELFIIGSRAGECAASEMEKGTYTVDQRLIDSRVNQLQEMLGRRGKNRPIQVKNELQKVMWDCVGPARNESKLKNGIESLLSIREKAKDLNISRARKYNTELIDAIELGFMIPVSLSIAQSALERKESRGAHVRLDYPQRDDRNWLKNIIIKKGDKDELEITLRPVELTKLKP
ncbi:MAG: FAD-binding protein [Thermodesulfobacteriota bacterium]|nr:FAD-binding protein [Thermodesulfobacteriota bacterium]